DPEYALGRAELAECCLQMYCKGWDLSKTWLDRAEAEARRALERAPLLPEGHRALGHLWNHRRDLGRALRDLHRAVELDPRFAGALVHIGLNYLSRGAGGRAEVYTRRALEADPGDPRAAVNLVAILLRQRRLAEGREAAARAMTLPLSRRHRLEVLESLMLSHLWETAGEEVEGIATRVEREFPPDLQARSLRAQAAAFAGRADEARRLLEREAGEPEPGNLVFPSRARALLMLGDREAALRELEQGSELDVMDVDELRTDPHLSTLAGEPRFERVLASQT